MYLIVSNNIHAGEAEKEMIEAHNNDVKDNGRATSGENSQSRDQVTEKDISNRVRKEVDSAPAAVENQVHDGILTAMDSVVIPKVESAVKSMIGL